MAHSNIIPLNVLRKPHEVIKPAKPTPHEYKILSDIDNGEFLRLHVPIIQFYHNVPALAGRDPVKVIRKAIEEALVFYYPLAGRLRKEVPGHKLLVECTGEGVLFIEADADVTLEYFGDVRPPFPLKELLYDVPGSDGLIDAPLLLIQVTRLKCGGFVLALRFNHIMCDGDGMLQFMTAVGEMARGACTPSVLPVWQREIFIKTNPPKDTHLQQESDHVSNNNAINFIDNMVLRSFYFGLDEISTLRMLIPPNIGKCSTFDILTACLWRCRTIALQPDPEEEMHIVSSINLRKKMTNPPLPVGYYGNALFGFLAISRAGDLAENPFGYTLDLVMKAKAMMTEEVIRLLLNAPSMGKPPVYTPVRTFIVSDITRILYEDVDFGWGKATYGGLAKADTGGPTNSTCFYISQTNEKGERGIVALVYLPTPAMERFETELDNMLK